MKPQRRVTLGQWFGLGLFCVGAALAVAFAPPSEFGRPVYNREKVAATILMCGGPVVGLLVDLFRRLRPPT